jgi:uncharacterized protein (TIGR00255 family)
MTGFARADTEAPGARLRWEIRSVNHRYLDLQVRLPDGLRSIEEDCRALISASVRRGKVDATLSMTLDEAALPAPEVDLALAKRVIDEAEIIAGEMARPGHLDPLSILRWPGVLKESRPTELEALYPAARDNLAVAVEELLAARLREGEKIHALLDGRCSEILEQVAAVRARLPAVLDSIRERMRDRIAALDIEANPERLEQELALAAQKLDVSEELERLEAHVSEIRTALQNDEPVGRRLDFLIQELNREANTLGSKSADKETTRHAVELKVLIEQMREQVQNVE